MHNAPSDLAHDLEDLNLAATRVQSHLEQRAYQLRQQAEALGPDLLATLVELANITDEHRAHRAKWAGVTYDDSEEQRREWAPLCGRLCAIEDHIKRVAIAVRDAAQLPLPTPKPASVRPAGEMAVYPESRL